MSARVPGSELRDRLAQELEQEAERVIAAYKTALDSDDPRVRVQAAEAWLSRVHGRPTERVETEDKTDLRTLTRAELEAELAKLYPHVVPQRRAS